VSDQQNELAELARQGQARLQAAKQGQDGAAQQAGDRNLRTAIGAVRGAPMRRLVLILMIVTIVGTIVGGAIAGSRASGPFAMLKIMPIGMTGFFAALGLLFLYLFMPPLASPAGVEAERAWAASLPFAFDWYFELLASPPSGITRVRVEITWASRGVDAQTLQGVIALFDTDSRVVEARNERAEITTGTISGSTGIRVNRVYVYRNHRLGTAMHRFVDVVLLPLHRNAPIARVKLSRA
jgi:hypothetical protein